MLDRTNGDGSTQAPIPAVADSWERIEAWLDEHFPVLELSLNPGASEEDLAKFEEAVGQSLPPDVRESWLIHDGQARLPIVGWPGLGRLPKNAGLIFGATILPLLQQGEESAEGISALDLWKEWAERAMDSDRSDDDGMLIEREAPGATYPAEAIQHLRADRAWIPLGWFTEDDALGIDLEPGPEGTHGQVISFGKGDCEKCVLAESWGKLLADFADELAVGNYLIDLNAEHREFRMKKPRPGTLRMNCKEWAEAKRSARLLG